MGALDECTSIRWLGRFGGMPKWLEMHEKCFKCHSCLISTTTKTTMMVVKPRNFHDMTPPKDANYFKYGPPQTTNFQKVTPPPPPPSKTASPPSQVINDQPLKWITLLPLKIISKVRNNCSKHATIILAIPHTFTSEMFHTCDPLVSLPTLGAILKWQHLLTGSRHGPKLEPGCFSPFKWLSGVAHLGNPVR